MLQTDAAVHEVLNHMAEMLLLEKGDVRAGVMVTIETTWENRLVEIGEEYRKTADDKKASVLSRYVDTVSQKHDALAGIRSLRQTLLDLASAHTAAAQERSADVRAVIAVVRDAISQMKELLAEARAARAAHQ